MGTLTQNELLALKYERMRTTKKQIEDFLQSGRWRELGPDDVRYTIMGILAECEYDILEIGKGAV